MCAQSCSASWPGCNTPTAHHRPWASWYSCFPCCAAWPQCQDGNRLQAPSWLHREAAYSQCASRPPNNTRIACPSSCVPRCPFTECSGVSNNCCVPAWSWPEPCQECSIQAKAAAKDAKLCLGIQLIMITVALDLLGVVVSRSIKQCLSLPSVTPAQGHRVDLTKYADIHA